MRLQFSVFAAVGMALLVCFGLGNVALFGQDDSKPDDASKFEKQADDRAAGANGEEILESLLDETGFLYRRQKMDDGSLRYRVAVEASEETTMVTARVHTWKWNRPDGSPLQSVYCFTQVLPPSDNDEGYPRAVLELLSEKSDVLLTGNYSATPEGVYANSGFYLPGLDADTLESYLFALHWNKVNLVTDLTPILEAEDSGI